MSSTRSADKLLLRFRPTDNRLGIEYLEGWVPHKLVYGSVLRIRCFGSRCVQIVAGNHPTVPAATIVRNAVMPSDAIIKASSNDPFTALAIARTMCDVAPDHPLTHLSVGSEYVSACPPPGQD